MVELPKRILFVRPGAIGVIGDVVDALCVASAVRQASPATRIGWVAHESALPLVAGHPAIDHAHILAKTGGAAARRRLIQELRACGYEAACDLQRTNQSAWLVWRSGAARRIGFARAQTQGWGSILTNEKVAGSADRYRVDTYLDFARHLGVPDPEPRWELPDHPEAAAWADARVAEFGGPPLVLNLGGSQSQKRWNPNSFGELARLAHKTFPEVPRVLIGGPSDAPGAVRAMSMTKTRHGLFDLVGHTSLPQLWELLRRARLVVTGDTAAARLAHAVRAPLLVLVGGSERELAGPHCSARIVRAPAASSTPSTTKGASSAGQRAALDALTPEMVFEAVAAELRRSGSESGLRPS